MMIPGPIQAGEVREFRPRLHKLCWC
jgi:hypothetical protein